MPAHDLREKRAGGWGGAMMGFSVHRVHLIGACRADHTLLRPRLVNTRSNAVNMSGVVIYGADAHVPVNFVTGKLRGRDPARVWRGFYRFGLVVATEKRKSMASVYHPHTNVVSRGLAECKF